MTCKFAIKNTKICLDTHSNLKCVDFEFRCEIFIIFRARIKGPMNIHANKSILDLCRHLCIHAAWDDGNLYTAV